MNRLKSGFCLLGTSMAVSGFGVAQAQDETPMLDRGTREASISGRIELPELDELDYDLDASYGYFFRDGWEAGIQIAAADVGGLDRIELSGFTEYNFLREGSWVPYIGGGIGLISANFDDDISLGTPIDDDGLIFDVEGGAKYFVRQYMAVSFAIDFKFSTEDVFATDDEIEDNLTSIKIGMRYYF